MHKLIREFYQQSPAGSSLARLPLDDGGLVACWEPGAPRRSPPRWIAKTAAGTLAEQRLAAEARALELLEADAPRLGIPRLLGWADGGVAPDGIACLLQTGVGGQRMSCRWNPGAPWRPLPPSLVCASQWLREFQRQVKPPRSVTLADLARDAQEWANADALAHAEFAPLLLSVGRLLPELVRSAGAAARELPAVAVHGDYWAGNVLLPPKAKGNPRGLRVVDWSGFDAGTALHDLLTFVFQMQPRGGSGRATRVAGWLAAAFTPGRVRDWARAWAESCGYGEACARLAFHVFLLNRMSWELGLRLQARDRHDVRAAHRDWTQLLAWLAQHRHPDPFTPLPVGADTRLP